MADNKVRRKFRIHFRDGRFRDGVLYSEGNIMMDCGEQISRLDHLISDNVAFIDFFLD